MSRRGDFGDKIIVTLGSDGIRRHKKWCEHYESMDNYCKIFCAKCIGSAFCTYYKNTLKEEPPIWRLKESEKNAQQSVAEQSAIAEASDKKSVIREFYRIAMRGEKLLGKIVLIRNTPYTFRIGEVVADSFDYMSVEYEGRIHKHEKKIVFRNDNVYVFDGYNICFEGESAEEDDKI